MVILPVSTSLRHIEVQPIQVLEDMLEGLRNRLFERAVTPTLCVFEGAEELLVLLGIARHGMLLQAEYQPDRQALRLISVPIASIAH